MDEVNYLDPVIAGGAIGAAKAGLSRLDVTAGKTPQLDAATMKSCLDFLFQAAVEQRMPLVASLIGAASDAVEEELPKRW